MSSIEHLYSVGLTGEIEFEVDIAALYPSVTPTVSRSLFLNTFDNKVYIVAYTEVPVSGVISQWTIIRGSQGTYSAIYQRGFGSSSRGIDSVAISPNGKYVAINGSDVAPRSIGHLIVFDVSTEAPVLDIETSTLTCSIKWLSNSQLAFIESLSACQECPSSEQFGHEMAKRNRHVRF